MSDEAVDLLMSICQVDQLAHHANPTAIMDQLSIRSSSKLDSVPQIKSKRTTSKPRPPPSKSEKLNTPQGVASARTTSADSSLKSIGPARKSTGRTSAIGARQQNLQGVALAPNKPIFHYPDVQNERIIKSDRAATCSGENSSEVRAIISTPKPGHKLYLPKSGIATNRFSVSVRQIRPTQLIYTCDS